MKEIGDVFIYKKEGTPSLVGNYSRKRGALKVVLVPYRTVSMRFFEYPFSSISKIREALKINYSILSKEQKVEVFPSVFSSDDGRYRGSALVISSSELNKVEESTGGIKKKIICPLPFALANRVDGNGIVVCSIDGNIVSCLFKDYMPLLYRWQSSSRKDIDTEMRWMEDYCKSKSMTIDLRFKADLDDMDLSFLVEDLRKTYSKTPELKNYNISREIIDSAEIYEKFKRTIATASIWLTIGGALFCMSAYIRTISLEAQIDLLKKNSVAIYRDSFGGRGPVRDPLSQAKGKLRDKTSIPDKRSLEEGVRIISRAWPREVSGKISIDSLRYGDSGLEIVGSASEVSLVQVFQKNLKNVDDSQIYLGDIQQIPGGGLRFSLDVRWLKR